MENTRYDEYFKRFLNGWAANDWYSQVTSRNNPN